MTSKYISSFQDDWLSNGRSKDWVQRVGIDVSISRYYCRYYCQKCLVFIVGNKSVQLLIPTQKVQSICLENQLIRNCQYLLKKRSNQQSGLSCTNNAFPYFFFLLEANFWCFRNPQIVRNKIGHACNFFFFDHVCILRTRIFGD